MQRITEFFRGVVREMKKVSWPKGKELTNYTVIVISTVIFFALFFTVIDLGITEIMNLVVE